MPAEPAKLALPPAEVTTSSSSSSSKQLIQGAARNRFTSRKGTKIETNEPEAGQSKQTRGRASTIGETSKGKTEAKTRSKSLQHSTVKDTNTNMAYWEDKYVGYIREQLVTHHGMRFGDPKDGMLYTRPRGSKIPANKMTKVDYLREMQKILNQQ